MKVGILQPSYLPWLGFFEQIERADMFVYYDDVQFEKGSWRNRNRIRTSNGSQWLTVPVITKGKGHQLIKDISINNTVKWQLKHLNAIKLNYSRASFYKEYINEIESILMRKYEKLIDLDMVFINWICNKLNINTPCVFSSDLNITGTNQERLIRILKHLEANCFYEGAAGRNYLNEDKFSEEGITIQFQDYIHPEYTQVFKPFISHLSSIDLLLNCGPDSINIIKQGTI